MSDYILNVVEKFSPRPFGRYRSDGDRSAQEFREEFLIPAMRQHARVTVDLSGTNYYGSSFLEETFGGLVRAIRAEKVLSLTKDDLDEKLKIVHTKLPSIKEEAQEYIQKAWDAK
ncbi:MAG: STAS-like domain-containing protein [Alphaproteobacteria bacterium]|nr:STAS-like domain-containing protein [Alphaproteobacteria bacterium]